MPSQSLVLLGDSILDNAPYTDPAPDTTTHLQRLLPDWSVRRHAQDGAVMALLDGQLEEMETDASVAVLSIGGNDAVAHIGLLEDREVGAGSFLDELLSMADDFEGRYEPVARAVAARCERTILCTIYEVPLEPPVYARRVRVPLALLNDRVVRVASRIGAEVLELRTVCTTPEDFVLQIEPSAQGAAKIAHAIAAVVTDRAGMSAARVSSAESRLLHHPEHR